MRPSVGFAHTAYQKTFEGEVRFMYLDIIGLVTCAIGLMVDGTPENEARIARGLPPLDPCAPALGLPWTISEYPATQQEIRVAWEVVKGHQELRQRGGLAFGPLTTLRLTDAGIDSVTLQKATGMEAVLRRYFPGYDDAPADAQLGLLSMAWALGPAFSPRWPMFTAAFRTGDWHECAAQCELTTNGNLGVAPRNAACKRLFEAAATTMDDDALTGWP